MSNTKIEQLIDEIEDYISGCKNKAFSSTEIIVNRDEIEGLLQELRLKTPEEIRRYQKIISNKEAILNDAREKANDLIQAATEQTNELISENEIMAQAYEQAKAILKDTTEQAQDILDKATVEANGLRDSAVQYTDDLLSSVENTIAEYINKSGAHYQALITSLTECYDTIRSNRMELRPEEPEEPKILDPEADDDSKINLDII